MNFAKTPLTKNQLLEVNPIVLAFVGDSVHTLFVRDDIVKSKNFLVGEQHKRSSNICKASHQSKLYDALLPHLTEEELTILKRAKNSKTHNKAKNADMEEYKKATAFEALIGWLWLQGDYDRMIKLLNIKLGE